MTSLLRSGLIVGVAFSALAPACSNSPNIEATATVHGTGVASILSALLVESGTILPDSGLVGTQNTYVEFSSNPAGSECSPLDAGAPVVAGSLSVPGAPTTMHGRVLEFGVTPDVFLTLNASEPSGSEDVDAGGGAATPPQLVAVSGTVTMDDLGGRGLSGTFSAQMVLASTPGGTPVAVSGSFTAPYCSD